MSKKKKPKPGALVQRNQAAPKANPGSSIQLTHFQQTMFSGPIPPPEMLAEYERIVPGLAERWFSKWEQEARHRQDLERDTLVVASGEGRDENKISLTGVYGAIALGLAAFVLAGWLGYLGHANSAAAVGTTTLAAIIGTMIWGTRRALRPPPDDKVKPPLT